MWRKCYDLDHVNSIWQIVLSKSVLIFLTVFLDGFGPQGGWEAGNQDPKGRQKV